MLMLRLFGGASLEDALRPVTGRAVQRRRLAVLAILALEHPRAVGRDRLIAWLWPEQDTERARHLLRDSLYLLRGAIGEDALESAGDELRLTRQRLHCDVWEFEEALAAGQPEAAVRAYTGPLLDGVHLGGSPELEQWIDAQRERLARAHARALEQLAEGAAADPRTAAEWWLRLAAVEPYNARVTLRLMQALEAAGDRAGALRQARVHAALLEQEFGATVDPEIDALAESLRSAPTSRAAAELRSVDEAGSDTPSGEAAGAVASYDSAGATEPSESDPPSDTPSAPPTAAAPTRRWLTRRTFAVAAVGVVSLLAILAAILLSRDSDAPPVTAAEASVANPRAIAVLPCANLSGDPEQEYFSDGLTEELTGALAQVRALNVVARTSAFAFKGQTRDVREIAETLGVGTILECSVRRAGERVRVTAQLINARNGFHLWAETYEREGTDIFAIQSDLALRIAGALQAELTPTERVRLARRPTTSPEAHALYQKGRYFWNQRTRSGYTRAIEYYERAIETDPRYAEAYAGLATVYSMQGIFGDRTPEEAYARTRDNALKALELDADVAEAHTVLGGYYHAHVWDSEAAEREHLRALELDPSNSTAHFWYGNFLSSMYRHDEAIAHKRKAVELDPLSPQLNWALGISLMVANRHDEAREQFRNAIELDSLYYPAYAALGDLYQVAGELDAAIDAYRRALDLSGQTTDARAGLARMLALAGRTDEARGTLAQLQTEAAESGVYAPHVATVYAALGDVDEAIAWLERAYAQRHPVLRFVGGPAFARLEDDPRYRELRRRIGLPV